MATKTAVGCVAGTIGIVFLAWISISMADVLGAGRVEVIYDRITGAIAEADDPEDKLAIIDASIDYFQQIREKVNEAREDSWRVANLFSAPEPVNLTGVRNIIDAARKAEQTIKTIGLIMIPIPKPALLPVKLINKAAEGLVGFFAFMTEGVTKSLENLATGMHTANLQALTLADLKEPLYPGLRRKEFVEAYNAILTAGEMYGKLGAVSSQLADNIVALQQMRTAIQAVEIEYKAWVKQTASLVDSQTREGDYEGSAFDDRAAAMSAKIDEFAEALGSAGVSQYKHEINEIIAIAKREAEGGAETMKLLESAGDNLEEAKRILAGCEKCGVRAEHHKGLLDGCQQEYDQAMAGLNQDTPSLIDDKAYSPKAFDNALYSRDLFGVRLSASGLEHYCASVRELLGIAAQLVRVEPAEDLISLPATLPDRLEIPLRVKVLNVLDEPLTGKSVNFYGWGDVQVSAFSAAGDDDGLSTADIIVWKSISNNISGSSVRAYIIDHWKTLEPNYVFVKPGSPASIDTISRPADQGAPGTRLPDAWVVAVKDADGNRINNIPLAVRFEALDGGGVSPIKTSNESGGSLFSADITLGNAQKSYRFRVSLIDPTGYTISQEIAVQADGASPYGSGSRDIPTEINFWPSYSWLAIDQISADMRWFPELSVAVYPETAYNFYVGGKTVTRQRCDHGPYDVLDPVYGTKVIEGAVPTIVTSPPGLVSIDAHNKKIRVNNRLGKFDIKAAITGITGYAKAHPECYRTVVQTGTIESSKMEMRVVGLKGVRYYGHGVGPYTWDDIFWDANPASSVRIYASKLFSDGTDLGWSDISPNPLEHVGLDVVTEGATAFTRSSLGAGELTGAGLARLYGFLRDSNGNIHHRQKASSSSEPGFSKTGNITLNTREVLHPAYCHAGDPCEVKVVVKGGADMSKYYCRWRESEGRSPHIDYVEGASFSSRTGFTKTGPFEWTSVNHIFYPEDAFEPSIQEKATPTIAVSLVEGESGEIVKSMLHSTSKSSYWKVRSPRMNKLLIKARRAGEAGDPYPAFSFDLFTDDTGWKYDPKLEIHPQAVFGEETEDYVFYDMLRLKLNDGPYRLVYDSVEESLEFDDIPVGFIPRFPRTPPPAFRRSYPIFLNIERIKRPGTLTLAFAVFSEDIDQDYYKTTLKEGRSVIFSQNKLDITLNVIRLDPVRESGGSYYRLLIDGPALMAPYVARWRSIGRDGSETVEESAFLRFEDGNWYAEMEKVGAPGSVQAEILDLNGLVLGRAELPDFPPGDVNLDGRVDLVDSILLLRHLAGRAELTDLQKRLANVTGHKNFHDIGLGDAMMILKVPAGDASALP